MSNLFDGYKKQTKKVRSVLLFTRFLVLKTWHERFLKISYFSRHPAIGLVCLRRRVSSVPTPHQHPQDCWCILSTYFARVSLKFRTSMCNRDSLISMGLQPSRQINSSAQPHPETQDHPRSSLPVSISVHFSRKPQNVPTCPSQSPYVLRLTSFVSRPQSLFIALLRMLSQCISESARLHSRLSARRLLSSGPKINDFSVCQSACLFFS